MFISTQILFSVGADTLVKSIGSNVSTKCGVLLSRVYSLIELKCNNVV